ncbi:cytochrome c oxidase assembly protein [Pelagibacterium xiamenense]|uniref:cytochrome c oxidase assembly protein n=1 Tax=Pelagibacterium xiamenense TaxID=2901140 RepID=UPI001E3F7E39|nr:cytochrome c oxidase assembly protein [Pelagibacterium xiamenense]MCD7059243.1 cytochrome c oxidase assembly protein [Pelagibacterium xiamenense]
MTAAHPMHRKVSNRSIVLMASGFVAFMVGMSFAAVPLYNIFCAVTGYGGTTQAAESNPKGVIDREMGVRFDANIDAGLPLRVEPASVTTSRMGEVETIVYRATNLSSEPLSTTASFNVTPPTTGIYFNKIECFCFTEQTIPPHTTVEMPVTYFVDPDLDSDDGLRTIQQITLSYTFHKN